MRMYTPKNALSLISQRTGFLGVFVEILIHRDKTEIQSLLKTKFTETHLCCVCDEHVSNDMYEFLDLIRHGTSGSINKIKKDDLKNLANGKRSKSLDAATAQIKESLAKYNLTF